ncbi:hypothetical protein [Micromonospora aurantiaca (nom. illeg.)]|uniref:hypothetical protein n=1 Tax=Micromonospora aurantiaca (nom. illeg.) TaxID=47850 RepID=UPI0033EFEBA2
MTQPVDQKRVLAALNALGWADDRASSALRGALYEAAEDAIRAADAASPCGHRAPTLAMLTGAAPTTCILAAGHTGWHHGDDGSRWIEGAPPAADLTDRLAAALTAALGALTADPAGRYHTSGYIPADVVDGWRALLAEHACPCLPGAPTHRHGEGGYAVEQPDWDHQIVFAADGTWTIDTRHPASCPAARPCLVERLAKAQVPSPAYHGLRGRYQCAVNDLGDRFLIGDRVTDGSACCVSEPASDDTTMTTPTIPDPAHTGPAGAACDTPRASSDVTGMTTPVTPDHPHTDPGDGRTECDRCGKWVWPAIHSCKGVPVTDRARARRQAEG